MATSEPVYNATTTTASTTQSKGWFIVPSPNLDRPRWFVKVLEVILSFVAFVLEELVENCTTCGPLYFFEFVSCTAFLFTLLLVILLSTPLQGKVGINRWPLLDFLYTSLITFFFFIASIVFGTSNERTSLEKATVVFGFLASIAFLIDVIIFLKTKGFPFLNRNKEPAGNSLAAVPEIERLNANANGGN